MLHHTSYKIRKQEPILACKSNPVPALFIVVSFIFFKLLFLNAVHVDLSITFLTVFSDYLLLPDIDISNRKACLIITVYTAGVT